MPLLYKSFFLLFFGRRADKGREYQVYLGNLAYQIQFSFVFFSRETFFLFTLFNLLGSSHRRCSIKKDVLKNFAKFTRKHLYQENTTASNVIKNRNSGTGVFLRILQNFYEHLFYRTSPVAASTYFS